MAVSILKPKSEFAGILRETETFAVANDPSFGNQLNGWFDRLMLQSGMALSPAMVLALCICSGLTFGGLAFVWQENLLTTAMAAFIGFLVPILVAMVVRSRRQNQILRQMPAMIDELARAARTGRSLENCLGIVAHDTPNPLGAELRHCTRKLALGLSIDESLKELPLRTGLIATSVLATALSVHRQTGGDLVSVLSRLSETLRDRIQFQGRLKAATAASRATAILMITLPPAILAFFVFRDPGYITALFESSWGMRSTVLAFILEIIGVVWVIRVLQTSARG
ncbi:type II secretion system F family protein [Planctomicrobium piriforme]|uniref:Tight adherence protein B n=1 Tax=Planctomicrobium piriforme TaxID=1576369 RepID=A0A1I3P5B7_9PLAN|nr:type II secretion system F family protein [Planctomicrobium piriforme]SFJ16743.1 tight adherence protein B [Planctomicrobium piriforme]